MARVSDSELNGLLAVVKNGFDPDSARALIEHLFSCLEEGIDSDEHRFSRRVLLEYAHHAFSGIVSRGISADCAFGLKLGRGKYLREDTTIRDVWAAVLVVLGMRNGQTALDAMGDAANRLFEDGKGDAAVRDAYQKYKDALEYLPDDLLKNLLAEPEDAQVISP